MASSTNGIDLDTLLVSLSSPKCCSSSCTRQQIRAQALQEKLAAVEKRLAELEAQSETGPHQAKPTLDHEGPEEVKVRVSTTPLLPNRQSRRHVPV
jgi:hypothetical protein